MNCIKSPFRLNISSEYCFCYLLAFAWSYNIIGMYVRVLFTKICLNSDIAGYTIMSVLIFLLIVKAQRYFKTKLRPIDIKIYVALVLIYLFYILFGNGTQEYLMNKMIMVLFLCYPFYFIGASLDAEHLLWLYKVSRISIIVCILYTLTLGINVMTTERMDQAYSLLPHICLVFYYFTRDKKIYDLLLSLLGAITLLFFGTRGPVLLCILFFIVCLLCFFGKTILQKVIAVMICSAIGTLVYYLSDRAVEYLGKLAANLGFSTRIFDSLSAESFFISSGRDVITETVLDYISKKPLSGYGLAYDRLIVESYSHNLLFEWCLSFGVIIGGMLFLMLIIGIIKSLINYRGSNCSIILLCIVFSCGLGKLFFSSSFLIEPYFFLMIGLIISMKSRRCRIGYY